MPFFHFSMKIRTKPLSSALALLSMPSNHTGIGFICALLTAIPVLGLSASKCSRLTCGQLGWLNGPYNGDPNVCSGSSVGGAETLMKGDKGCSGDVSWDKAVNFCEDLGARLCTFDELQNDEVAGAGCGPEIAPIWTSTGCHSGSHMVGYGNSQVKTAPECIISDTAVGYYARCCGDARCAGAEIAVSSKSAVVTRGSDPISILVTDPSPKLSVMLTTPVYISWRVNTPPSSTVLTCDSFDIYLYTVDSEEGYQYSGQPIALGLLPSEVKASDEEIYRYSWIVPEGVPNGDQYSVQVNCKHPGLNQIDGYSEGTFTILGAGTWIKNSGLLLVPTSAPVKPNIEIIKLPNLDGKTVSTIDDDAGFDDSVIDNEDTRGADFNFRGELYGYDEPQGSIFNATLARVFEHKHSSQNIKGSKIYRANRNTAAVTVIFAAVLVLLFMIFHLGRTIFIGNEYHRRKERNYETDRGTNETDDREMLLQNP